MITKADIKAVANELNRFLDEQTALRITKEANSLYPLMKDYRSTYSVIRDLVEDVEVFN